MINMLEKAKDHVAVLCRKHSVKRLTVFGSAAIGSFSSVSSDLDFLVEFEHGLSAMEYAQAYFGLRDDLKAYFAREVDLVTPHSMTNPYFKRSVEASEQLLYAA